MSSTPHKPGKRSRQSSHSLERVGSALTTPQRSPALQPSAAAALPPPPQQQRPSLSSSLPRSSSPPASLDAPQTHKQKKNKKAKAEAAAAAAAAKAKAAHTGNGKSGDKSDSAAAAAQSRRLLQCLSEVELQFQLEQDRTQRTTLSPRDLANLILWSVPAPVPLIESPRIFFIKNKSRVRNVTVIYVNGWSYDELLCTGVGLPRQPATSTPSVPATTTSAQNAAPADCSEEWDKFLCSAMLSPVREARCWARPGRGSGCAGGVQYAPLNIPSTRNELEKDLWWRNDAPRRPRDGSSSSSGGNRGVSGNPSTTPADAQGSGAEAFDRTAASSLFRLAMQSHTAAAAAAEGTGTAEKAAGNGDAPASNEVTSPFHAHQDLWRDRALLTSYALRLPTHAAELTELGFTLTSPPLPPPPALASSRLDRIDEEGGEKETPSAADGVEEQQWACFDAPVSAASSSSTAGTADDGTDTPQLRVVALDCEMVLVESGESALARATLVDVLTGDVVMDILVKPQQRIADYLTRFSGIDKDMLDPVSTTLADCQAQMKRFIDTSTFVIGHSLENDFKACRFIPNCEVLDTAWLFPHPAGLPYKNALRFLAQRYLNRRIQQGAHDSAVDALVSAELVQLKLLHGPTFGIRPRVSVLSLITAAAAVGEDTAPPPSTTTSIAASTPAETATAAAPPMRASRPAPTLDVHVHLFDDPVTLTAILPAGDAGGRIDAVPVRHDEDATRKIVRALQRRSTELRAADAREEKSQMHDGLQTTGSMDGGEGDDAAMAPPSFGLYWVQLTQTKVDVVLPKPSNGGDGVVGDATSSTATTASKEHTAAQFQTVHDTNRRILRVIEACPDETVVVVLAGRCNGEAGGNHFSRAQGTCFAFVKDSTAPGPREEELVRRTVEDGAADKEQHQHHHGDHKVANGASSGLQASAVLGATPPACQQQ